MSGVKHTPVHPDNTAWRAVDACGGIYTPAEEASGFAAGHRAALASAMVAVGHADGITAALLEALEAALNTSGARQSGYHAIEYSTAVAQAENAIIKARATGDRPEKGGAL